MKGCKVRVDEDIGWRGLVVSEPVHTMSVNNGNRYHDWFVLVMNASGEIISVNTDDLIVQYTVKGSLPSHSV